MGRVDQVANLGHDQRDAVSPGYLGLFRLGLVQIDSLIENDETVFQPNLQLLNFEVDSMHVLLQVLSGYLVSDLVLKLLNFVVEVLLLLLEVVKYFHFLVGQLHDFREFLHLARYYFRCCVR